MARAPDAFDQFVAAHVDDLLRTAFLIAWDEAEAEDLVQECLLKVARTLAAGALDGPATRICPADSHQPRH
jgi:DNA-directed RNA polymerase specialized sigma24 family protein